MKRLLRFIVAVCVVAAMTGCNSHFSSFFGGWSDADLTAVTDVIQTAGIPADLKGLTVDNRFGTIHITGTDHGTTSWTWRLTVRARSDSVAQQIASNTICKAEVDGDHLSLAVSLPDSKEPHSIQSNLEITAPKSIAVQAENRFGIIIIADLAGKVEATNENGRLEIRNITGSVQARTSFDTLSVSNTGPATLKDQNGDIRAVVVAGPLEADTSFASLVAEDIQGPASLANQNGEIKAESIHGALDATTSFDSLTAEDIGGTATLRDQNGRIEVTGIGGALEAKTSFDSLVARDIGGPVHLRDQNGSIKIVQAGGNADIETSFASLNVEGIQGNAILVNQNGDVKASGITGSVEAATSFATMEVKGGGPKFVCHNQNGAIRLWATSAGLTNIEANTSFDTLDVHLPAALKPAIQARTTFADVESDFPVLMKRPGENPFADVSPGTPRITLQNQDGKITVLRD